jgi:hypothetical protein
LFSFCLYFLFFILEAFFIIIHLTPPPTLSYNLHTVPPLTLYYYQLSNYVVGFELLGKQYSQHQYWLLL